MCVLLKVHRDKASVQNVAFVLVTSMSLPHLHLQIFALLGIHEFFPSASILSFLEGVLCM